MAIVKLTRREQVEKVRGTLGTHCEATFSLAYSCIHLFAGSETKL
jgi:hypothetical protein